MKGNLRPVAWRERSAARVRWARLLLTTFVPFSLLMILLVALNWFVQLEWERLDKPIVPGEAVPRLKREDLTHFTRQYEKFRPVPVPPPTPVPSPTPSADRRSRQKARPVSLP